MTTEIREFRRMLEAGRRYLSGACTIQELNGFVSELTTAVKFFGGHAALAQIASDWSTMVDRHWNEWGHCPNPLTLEQFHVWLEERLTQYPAVEKYKSEDLLVIKFEDHIKRYSKMYFGEQSVSPIAIAEAIEYVAKRLGATQTRIKKIDDWCYFCADLDWIFESKADVTSIEEVFFGFKSFPEGGQNSYRCEALCAAFSSAIYTLEGGEVYVLKGAPPEPDVCTRHLHMLGIWARIVGFRFELHASKQ